jgi:HD-GYP domain-containing protein (c-di-GMP phosphodiesterase class II)
MSRDRVHRRAMTLPEAIAEVSRNAGTQFDPVVVEAFLRAVDAGEIVYQEVPAR